ncbi:MAG: hypothetical protein ACWA5L_05670 [bacterium]
MLFKNISTIMLIVVTMTVTACGNSEKQEAEYKSKYVHEVSDRNYKSDYFNIEIPLPESWYMLDFEQMNAVANVGQDIIVGENESLQKVMEASERNSYNLFGMFKYELGAAVPFNPNILSVAENLKLAPAVKTGKDYFFHTKQLLTQSGFGIDFDDAYYTRDIDGVTFDQMNLVMPEMGVQQSYYAARDGDFMFSIILTYSNDEEKAELEQALDKIKLNWK